MTKVKYALLKYKLLITPLLQRKNYVQEDCSVMCEYMCAHSRHLFRSVMEHVSTILPWLAWSNKRPLFRVLRSLSP